MTDKIEAAADSIRSMRVRGAGNIARVAASALSEFSLEYEGGSLDLFRKDLEAARQTLLDSRPTAVSLWSGLQACMKGIASANALDEARAIVSTNARAFVERSNEAVKLIAEYGANEIQDGDVILTHCNSSAALRPIVEAHRQGKGIRVFATESRPWRQGILTVNELALNGIDVTLIIDSTVRTVMSKVDRVFVGADTISSDGHLINKIGTSQVASMANEFGVKFNVCSETYKFSPKTLFGEPVAIEERDDREVVGQGEVSKDVKIFNPVFDVTPPKYISSIITELGVIHPSAVYGVMVSQFGEGLYGLRG